MTMGYSSIHILVTIWLSVKKTIRIGWKAIPFIYAEEDIYNRLKPVDHSLNTVKAATDGF